MGLAALLGVSRRNLPSAAHQIKRDKGLALYLPEMPPVPGLVRLIRSHLGDSELVEVEPRPAVLSNVVYQSGNKRAIVHLLNYRQDRQQNLHLLAHFPVAKVEILSPDELASRQAAVARRGNGWEVVVPELRTYDLVAVYARP